MGVLLGVHRAGQLAPVDTGFLFSRELLKNY